MNLGDVRLTVPYTSGSGALTVTNMTAVLQDLGFAPNQIQIYDRTNAQSPKATYSITSASGCHVTGLSLVSGTDANHALGDAVMLQLTSWGGSGSGTVTAVSVASANGFSGSSSGVATPALTLTTSITGMLKGNGTAIQAAVSDTDYQAPITF